MMKVIKFFALWLAPWFVLHNMMWWFFQMSIREYLLASFMSLVSIVLQTIILTRHGEY